MRGTHAVLRSHPRTRSVAAACSPAARPTESSSGRRRRQRQLERPHRLSLRGERTCAPTRSSIYGGGHARCRDSASANDAASRRNDVHPRDVRRSRAGTWEVTLLMAQVATCAYVPDLEKLEHQLHRPAAAVIH